MTKDSRLFQVRREILELPHVRAVLEQTKVSAGTDIKLGEEYVKFGKDFSLSLSNATCAKFLTRLFVLAISNTGWSIDTERNKEFLVMNF
jgi:hypothetical protein